MLAAMIRPANLRPRGLTLVEVMVAVSVLGILLAVAVPAMLDLIHRKRVEGVAQELASDLAFMKAAAAIRSDVKAAVHLKIGTGEALNCYAIVVANASEETTCNCLMPPGMACKNTDRADAEIKVVRISANSGIKLVSAPRRDAFIDGHDLSWPLQIRVEGPRSGVLRVDLAKGAFVRVCTPDSSMAGYPECS